jgi:hypothetical protein
VIFATVCLRLNVLKAERHTLSFWIALEVMGLAALLAGCAGSIGEWFLPNAEFHAETIVLCGAAMFALGSRAARSARSWRACRAGTARSAATVDARCRLLHAHEFLEGRFQRRS